MNIIDTEDLKDIKRFGPKTDRERVLLEALAEEEETKIRVSATFLDYPSTDDIRPDLERIRETLKGLRELADGVTEDWFTDMDTPAPKIDAENTGEQLAAVCYKISNLFSSDIMDFDDLEALETAGEVYEVAEKASLEVYQ